MPKNYPEPTVDMPSVERLSWMAFDLVAEATDGCEIEIDGICEHGHPSWFLLMEMV